MVASQQTECPFFTRYISGANKIFIIPQVILNLYPETKLKTAKYNK